VTNRCCCGCSDNYRAIFDWLQLPFKHAFVVLDTKITSNLLLNDFELRMFSGRFTDWNVFVFIALDCTNELIYLSAYLSRIYLQLLIKIGIDVESLVFCANNRDKDANCGEGGKIFIDNSYNILLTADYMMLVPRSVPNADLNINAMGMNEFLVKLSMCRLTVICVVGFFGLLLSQFPNGGDILR
jgi:hypothetical protein